MIRIELSTASELEMLLTELYATLGKTVTVSVIPEYDGSVYVCIEESTPEE